MAVMKHYIIVGNRKYEYVLEPSRTRTMLVCEGAGINARYDNGDIPRVLASLAETILRLSGDDVDGASEALRFRVSPAEKERIMRDAYDAGYENVSSYLRDKVLTR